MATMGILRLGFFRKLRNPNYKEFKKSEGKEASTVEIIPANVENSLVGTEGLVEPIELCLANMERYIDNIEHESQEERCADSDEYKFKRKSDDGYGVKLSYVRELSYLTTIMGCKVAPIDNTGMYISQQVD